MFLFSDTFEEEVTNTPHTQDIDSIRNNYVQFLNEGYRAKYGTFPLNQKNPTYMSPLQHQQLVSKDLQDYINHQRHDPLDYSRRQKRAASNKHANYYQSGGGKYRYSRRRKKSCSRHELYVDFEEIGWSGWIISPKGYNAYHCKGECPFPLGQNQKPTTHATVQSIVHAMRIGKDVGTPCCVPNKLFSISLLYFDDEENVILKQYDDMVAASCGCH